MENASQVSATKSVELRTHDGLSVVTKRTPLDEEGRLWLKRVLTSPDFVCGWRNPKEQQLGLLVCDSPVLGQDFSTNHGDLDKGSWAALEIDKKECSAAETQAAIRAVYVNLSKANLQPRAILSTPTSEHVLFQTKELQTVVTVMELAGHTATSSRKKAKVDTSCHDGLAALRVTTVLEGNNTSNKEESLVAKGSGDSTSLESHEAKTKIAPEIHGSSNPAQTHDSEIKDKLPLEKAKTPEQITPQLGPELHQQQQQQQQQQHANAMATSQQHTTQLQAAQFQQHAIAHQHAAQQQALQQAEIQQQQMVQQQHMAHFAQQQQQQQLLQQQMAQYAQYAHYAQFAQYAQMVQMGQIPAQMIPQLQAQVAASPPPQVVAQQMAQQHPAQQFPPQLMQQQPIQQLSATPAQEPGISVMGQPGNRELEDFLQTHQINTETAAALRELPLELQHSLVQSRPLIGNNMSVVLMARIRKAEAVITSASTPSQVPLSQVSQEGSNPLQAQPADMPPPQFGGDCLLQPTNSQPAEKTPPADTGILGLKAIAKSPQVEHVETVMPNSCAGGNDTLNVPHRTWDEVSRQQPGDHAKAQACVAEVRGIEGWEANAGKGKSKTPETCSGKRMEGNEKGGGHAGDEGVSDSMWEEPMFGGEGSGQPQLLPRVVPTQSSKAGKLLPLPQVASPRPAMVKWKANATSLGSTSEAQVVPPPPKRMSNSGEMGATPKNRAIEAVLPRSAAADAKSWSVRPGSFLSMPAGPSPAMGATLLAAQQPGSIAMSKLHGIAAPTAKQLAFAQTIANTDSAQVQGLSPVAMHAVDLTGVTGGKGGQLLKKGSQ